MSDSSKLAPVNIQNLDIRSTPREEMDLVELDTFKYEYPGRKIWIDFEIPEFTAICPFSDFPDFAVIRLRPERKMHRAKESQDVHQLVSQH
jgi:NADPH-dependent 7-cyano-7-deazaguanine reductase QueF